VHVVRPSTPSQSAAAVCVWRQLVQRLSRHAGCWNARVLGPNGFGVVITGTSLLDRGIADGDTVWIDPDQPYACADVVLAPIRDPAGCGVAVQIFAGDHLEDVECRDFSVIGPAICLTRPIAKAGPAGCRPASHHPGSSRAG